MMSGSDSGRDSPVTSFMDEDVAQRATFEFFPEDQTKKKIQDVDELLMILQQSYEPARLMAALVALLEQSDDATKLEYMEENLAHLSVIEVMRHLALHTDIQQIGFKILCKFLINSTILKESLQLSEAYVLVLRVVCEHVSDAQVQALGMQILALLVASGNLRMQILLDEKLAEVMDQITVAVTGFRENPAVQTYAIMALNHMLTDDFTQQENFMKVEFNFVLDSLQINSHVSSVVQQTFNLLNTLAKNDYLCESLIGEHEIPDLIMTMTQEFLSNEDVLQAGFQVLAEMSKTEEVQSLLVKSGYVDEILSPTMLKLPANVKIQLAGLTIAEYTASTLVMHAKGGNPGYTWLKNIYYAMSKHIEQNEIQITCNKLLAKLLKLCPELSSWIGENRQQTQDPIHTLVLGSLLMHGKNQEICETACEAVYWLCADNEEICDLLMSKNAFIAVVERMKSFRYKPDVVAACCRALRGLCIFCEKNRERVCEYNTLSYLLPLTEAYLLHPQVQIEIFALLACLADTADVRNQCIREGVQRKILAALDNTDYSPILHEVGIETLTVLAGAVSGPEVLNYSESLQRVVNSMTLFPDNLYIQKKGLILMQLLADDTQLESDDRCRRLAKTIDAAMQRFPNNHSIQAEGCVALQLLSEKSELMSAMVVKEGCHQTLFTLLTQSPENTGIPDLASECLFELGNVGNLNSKMLLSMCERGTLESVECLVELGADVNYGHGQTTPLCLACQRCDEDMVRFLLKQGVSDIQTALKLSIDNKSHSITGLLLKYLGHDREGGIVTWSNLGLGDLQPEWLAPTLLEELITPEMSASGRKMASKVKSSEERIERRMHFLQDKPHLLDHTLYRYPRQKSGITEQASAGHQIPASASSPTLSKRRESLTQARDRVLKRLFSHKKMADNPRIHDVLPIPTPAEGKPPPSSDNETLPSFRLLNGEYEDWRRTSLSGSNIPYNINDPRLHPESPSRWPTTTIDNCSWLRKDLSGDTTPAPVGPVGFPSLPTESGYFSVSSSVGRARRGRRPSLPAIPTFSDEPMPSGMRKRRESRGALGIIKERTFEDLRADYRRRKQDGSDPELPIIDLPRRSTFWVPVPMTNEPEEDITNRKRSNTLGALPSFAPVETNVTCLDVSANHIRTLTFIVMAGPGIMDSMRSLEKLDLSKNYLEEIPGELLKHLGELKHLELRSNNISDFPLGVFHCAALAHLDLSHNKIEDISTKMFVTSFAIRELNLSYNQLSEFPLWVGQCMPGLEKLELAGNKISSLPDFPLMLKRLKRLDISHNSIRTIPEVFLTECARLETFEAINNQLEKLPSEEVAKTLLRLNKLCLSKNNLTEKEPLFVPKFILELPSLRSVNLSENGLLGLPPPGLWKTQLLKELYVSRNNITELNLENCGMAWSCLETFHIAYNQLTELPKEIGNLASLSSLAFNHNKNLTTLPDDLGRCSKLWEMPLDGLMLDLDQALLKSRVKDIVVYLHHKLKKARRHYRMKMIVVGYGGKGKSTLLRSIVRKRQPEKSVATVGILVGDWKYERKTREGRAQQYTLSTWDFAGQEDFYSSHQCFLSNRALYLVVYKMTGGEKEISQLKPWLLNIHSRAPGCPVVVVGTHVDQVPGEKRAEIIQDMREKIGELMTSPGFPTLSGLIEIDATSRDSSSMDRLRNLIKVVVDEFKIRGQPVMGQKIPASYVRLAELITEEANSLSVGYPVIRHHKMKKMVKQSGLDMDEEELLQAVRFLHEWGVLLHYNDTTLQMKDLYFIDPGWLCRMMAQVITVREINPFINKDGVLKKNNVKLLFTGRAVDGETHYTFPPSLLPHYLRLLEKFEIALPQNDEELLIPCRLPVQKPNITVPKSGQTGYIRREYHMPYIPMGFWARLLARLIVFCKKMTEQNNMSYWREGIYVHWSDEKYFLLQPCDDNRDNFQILAPASRDGSSLMGNVVDHVDALTEEWFPGLMIVDPILGRELLQKFVPCSLCPTSPAHLFPLNDLLEKADSQNAVLCPIHGGLVPLSALAPDIMLSDLECKYKLDLDQFIFVPSPQYLIGDGGFGSVYSAQYKGQVVAVKTFNTGQDIHPHKLLRQEATILSKLHHPSIISLIAVSIKPRVMVIEFAPLGSLGGLLKAYHKLSRGLQHRISLQVSEGLSYLHDNMIMYRDMKPDNILLFNLSLSSQINAKLSDYGISREATLYGLTLQEGTPGYRAPEVARGETYSFSADIFSLGITLYQLMAGGRHPFEHLEYPCEIDKAIAEGKPIPPLNHNGDASWPDMQDLITDCTQQVPDRRPLALQVYERLTCPELLCLKQVVPISSGVTVESIAIRSSGEDRLEAWIGSGDKDCVQLSWICLPQTKTEAQGMIFSDSRILCLLAVGPGHVLVGTQSGRIWVYDARQYRCKHSLPQLTDAILCMQIVQGTQGEECLLAGMADGKLALFPITEVLQNADTLPELFDLGHDYEPIKCICQHNGKLYVSCGANIFCLRYDFKVTVETMWMTAGDSNNRASTITSMVLGKFLFISKKGSSIIESWEVTRGKLRDMVDVADILGNLTEEFSDTARVTSLALQNSKTLWLGTGGGHVILLDGLTLNPLIVTHRYTSSVRSIMVTRPAEGLKSAVILTGGLGFRSRSKFDVAKEDQFGCLAVWEGDFANQIKTLREELRKRQDLIDKYSPTS